MRTVLYMMWAFALISVVANACPSVREMGEN